MKKILSMCAVMVLLGAVSAQGGDMLEYVGINGNINQAQGVGDPSPGNSWFKYMTGDKIGTYEAAPLRSLAGLGVDPLMLRNGTTTTLEGQTINSIGFFRIGEQISGDVGSGVDGTKLYIRNGGVLSVSAGADTGTLRIGEDYNAAVYVEEGGTIDNNKADTNARLLWVGIDGRNGDPNAEARLYVTGGFVWARSRLGIGGWGSLNGRVDISGGVIKSRLINVGNCSTNDYAPGTGTGVLAVSGAGVVEAGDTGISLGDGYGSGANHATNGTLEQTGGTVRLVGTFNCDVKIGPWGTGLYSLTGGVLKLTGTSANDIIVGGGVSGRFKVGQGGKVVSSGSYQTSTNATLELLIGSAANFDMSFLANSTIDGNLAITLTGGYTPTQGQEWKVMSTAGTLTGAFDITTQNWAASVRNEGGLNNLYVKYTLHAADANGDNLVDVGDLGILAGNWGGSGKTWAQGDFTGDGLVDVGDLGVLAGNWGWAGGGGSMQPVPEPATLGLLALGAIGLVRRRRS